MSEERLSGDLAAIEAALCSLTPTPSGIQRDRLMFLAGKVSAETASVFGVRRFIAAFRGTVRTAAPRCYPENKAAMNRRTPKLLWPIATAASLVMAVTFGILWATGGNAKIVARAADVSVASLPTLADASADTSPPSPWENRRLYRLVLEKGIDALPESTGHFVPGAPSMPHEKTYRSLLKQFLDNPTG